MQLGRTVTCMNPACGHVTPSACGARLRGKLCHACARVCTSSHQASSHSTQACRSHVGGSTDTVRAETSSVDLNQLSVDLSRAQSMASTAQSEHSTTGTLAIADLPSPTRSSSAIGASDAAHADASTEQLHEQASLSEMPRTQIAGLPLFAQHLTQPQSALARPAPPPDWAMSAITSGGDRRTRRHTRQGHEADASAPASTLVGNFRRRARSTTDVHEEVQEHPQDAAQMVQRSGVRIVVVAGSNPASSSTLGWLHVQSK